MKKRWVTFKPQGGKLLGAMWMCPCGNPEPISYQKTSNRDEHAAQGRVDVGEARIAHCVRCNTVHFGVMTTRMDCVPAHLVEERDAKIRAEALEEAAIQADLAGHSLTAHCIRMGIPEYAEANLKQSSEVDALHQMLAAHNGRVVLDGEDKGGN